MSYKYKNLIITGDIYLCCKCTVVDDGNYSMQQLQISSF